MRHGTSRAPKISRGKFEIRNSDGKKPAGGPRNLPPGDDDSRKPKRPKTSSGPENYGAAPPISRKIKCYQINLQHASLPSVNLDRVLTRAEGSTIAFITEPWLFRKQVRGLPKTGYKLFHAQSDEPRSAIMVSSDIDSWLMPELSGRDLTVVRINGVDGDVMVASYYADLKIPHVSELLERAFDYCESRDIAFLVAADSNAHSVLWNCPKTRSRGRYFEDFLLRHGAVVHNEGAKPTFDNNRGSTSIIDITFSRNFGDRISDWKVHDEDSFSDHKMISFECNTSVSRTETLIRALRKADWSKVTSMTVIPGDYKEVPLRTIEDIDKEEEAITEHLTRVLDELAPKKPLPNRKPQPWWSDEIARLRREVRRIHKRARRSGNSSLWSEYKERRKEYQKLINGNKKSCWKTHCSRMSGRSLVNVLKEKKFDRDIGMLRKPDGTLTTDRHEMLNLLMESHIPECSDDLEDEPAVWSGRMSVLATVDNVTESLGSFEEFKASGPDEIPPALLRRLDKTMVERITRLYNACLGSGYTPSNWRKSKMIFIPKPGIRDPTDVRTYRPITLTNFLLKGLEKLTTWYNLDDTRLGDLKDQYGFSQNKSTEHALSVLVNRIEKQIYRCGFALGVFIDIQGAFDNLQFDRVNEAYVKYRVRDEIRLWYDYYLRNRQVTSYSGGKSCTKRPTRGGPQGGCASTQAWNGAFQPSVELSKGTEIIASAFADDLINLILGHSITEMFDLMQKQLNKLLAWADKNFLKLSVKKTKVVFFTRDNFAISSARSQKLYLGNDELEIVDAVSYLGVMVDRRLSWNQHVDAVVEKAKKLLHATRRVVSDNWGLDVKRAKWVYDVVVKPAVTYGAVVWSPELSKTNWNKLEGIQRLACLTITGGIRTAPTRGLELIAGIPPIEIAVEKIALQARMRTKKLVPRTWSGEHVFDKTRRGHLTLLDDKLSRTFGEEAEQECRWTHHLWNWNRVEAVWKDDASTYQSRGTLSYFVDVRRKGEDAAVGWALFTDSRCVREGGTELRWADVTQAYTRVTALVARDIAENGLAEQPADVYLRDKTFTQFLLKKRGRFSEEQIALRNDLSTFNVRFVVMLGLIHYQGYSRAKENSEGPRTEDEERPREPERVPLTKAFIRRKLNERLDNHWHRHWRRFGPVRPNQTLASGRE